MTSTIPIEQTLTLAGILFVTGFAGLLFRRNVMFVLMSIEIMLNAAALAFIAAGAQSKAPDGQVMFIFILAMAATEVAVGLALVLEIYRHFKTLDIDAMREMRG